MRKHVAQPGKGRAGSWAGVALLLWGIRMVRTGITRSFGATLRQALAAGTRTGFRVLCRGRRALAEQHGDRLDGGFVRN